MDAKWIMLVAGALVAGAVGVAFWFWHRARRRSRQLEDQFVEFYTASLKAIDQTLVEQEKTIQSLQEKLLTIGASIEPEVMTLVSKLGSSLAHSRGQFATATLSQGSPSANWSAFMGARAGCEGKWGEMVRSLCDLIVHFLKDASRRQNEDGERRVKLTSAHSRIMELETQVENMLRQTAQSKQERQAKDDATADAARNAEDRWDSALHSARKQDEAQRHHMTTMAAELENLESLNQRLTSLAERVRERHQAMAKRIAELEVMAELTPMLREELKSLGVQNEELRLEMQRLEATNGSLEKEMQALRGAMRELEAQPSRFEAVAAEVAHDRQVMQLLRDQNQRLILELEDVREELERSSHRRGDMDAEGRAREFEKQVAGLTRENQELVAQFELIQTSLDEKEREIQRLTEESNVAQPAGARSAN